jgi:hypothetical protein
VQIFSGPPAVKRKQSPLETESISTVSVLLAGAVAAASVQTPAAAAGPSAAASLPSHKAQKREKERGPSHASAMDSTPEQVSEAFDALEQEEGGIELPDDGVLSSPLTLPGAEPPQYPSPPEHDASMRSYEGDEKSTHGKVHQYKLDSPPLGSQAGAAVVPEQLDWKGAIESGKKQAARVPAQVRALSPLLALVPHRLLPPPSADTVPVAACHASALVLSGSASLSSGAVVAIHPAPRLFSPAVVEEEARSRSGCALFDATNRSVSLMVKLSFPLSNTSAVAVAAGRIGMNPSAAERAPPLDSIPHPRAMQQWHTLPSALSFNAAI